MKINETKLDKNALISKIFERIDYVDSFDVSYENKTFSSIEDFAREYFLSQPFWLRSVSQNSLSSKKIIKDIEKSNFAYDTNIGSWKIYAKDANEIVFGEAMGFMDYRFSMKLKSKNYINISTIVQINSFMGKFYFSLVKLLHKKFVLISLKNVEIVDISHEFCNRIH